MCVDAGAVAAVVAVVAVASKSSLSIQLAASVDSRAATAMCGHKHEVILKKNCSVPVILVPVYVASYSSWRRC